MCVVLHTRTNTKGSGKFIIMLKAAEKIVIEDLDPDHLPKRQFIKWSNFGLNTVPLYTLLITN